MIEEPNVSNKEEPKKKEGLEFFCDCPFCQLSEAFNKFRYEVIKAMQELRKRL